MKSYIKTQNRKKYLFFETESGEEIDKVAAGMLENNDIPGLLKFSCAQFDDRSVVKYDISGMSTISELLEECIKKDRIISVIDTILTVYSDAENYLLEPESIMLDCDRIYFRKEDQEICMVVFPVLNKNSGNPDISVFLKNLICRIKFDSSENCDYIGKMLGYLNSSTDFSLSDFMYIVSEQKALSVSANEETSDIYSEENIIPVRVAEYSDCVNEPEKEPEFIIRKPIEEKISSESGLRLPLDFYADDEEEEFENKKSLFSKLFGDTKNKGKSRKKENGSDERISVHYCDSNGEIKSETEYPDSTVIISKNRRSQKASFLLRLKNNEKIYLMSDSFRLGSEKNSVDYCIKDNSAVSRLHAEIIHKNNGYFIIDNNSTNHTYLNEHEIRSQHEMKLQNKSRIRLADEEFIFYS